MLHKTHQMLHKKYWPFDLMRGYKIHILCWSIFICYEIVMVGLINEKFNTVPYYLAFYMLNMILFYSFAHQILPFPLKAKRYVYIVLPFGIAITFCVYYGITLFLDALLRTLSDNSHPFNLTYVYTSILRSLYRFLLFIGFSTGYYYLITFLKERRRVEEKEKENLFAEIQNQNIQSELVKSQNALLKAQINPHFLFNTLNYIFTSSRKRAPEAAEAIMSLSDIMRFSIDIGNSREESEILLELEQVENLIHLHKLRVNGSLYIDVEYSAIELAEVKIIPLVIITLVENIFKHGDLERPDRPAKLKISHNSGILEVVTENYKHDRTTISHHIGLENIKKRLELAYNKRADFSIINTDPQIFKTVLSIG